MSQDYEVSPEHETLYHIPIETLGLSEKAIKAVKRMGITTVGDCVDHLQRGNDAMITVSFDYPEFMKIMQTEVKAQLEAHGYWPPSESDTP